MINLNSSKDGFRPRTEKPTASSEDFFSPFHCNTARIHLHSPFILLLFHLVSGEIPSVSLGFAGVYKPSQAVSRCGHSSCVPVGTA